MIKYIKRKLLLKKAGNSEVNEYIINKLLDAHKYRVREHNIKGVYANWFVGNYTLDEAIEKEIQFIRTKVLTYDK